MRYILPGAVVLLIVLLAPHQVGAQNGPHYFFGGAEVGSGARLDGRLVPDGEIVTAWNLLGEIVGTYEIREAKWVIQVDPSSAASIFLTIGDPPSTRAGPFEVVPLRLTEVALNERSLPIPPRDLPATGSGGLADHADTGADAALWASLATLVVVGAGAGTTLRFRQSRRGTPPGG